MINEVKEIRCCRCGKVIGKEITHILDDGRVKVEKIDLPNRHLDLWEYPTMYCTSCSGNAKKTRNKEVEKKMYESLCAYLDDEYGDYDEYDVREIVDDDEEF